MDYGYVISIVADLLSEADLRLFKKHAVFTRYRSGAVFDPGPGCREVYFIERGGMRIYRLNEDGKEISLYRIRSGEVCLLSLGGDGSPLQFSSSALIDGETVVLKLPQPIYAGIFSRNGNFQQYILENTMRALNSVMHLSEELAFQAVDKRVAMKILELMNLQGGFVLKTTHVGIANELGTAREVVSRVLKNLSEEGIISRTRGKIEVINVGKLKKICAP